MVSKNFVMFIGTGIVIAILLAAVFVGLAYYQAHQRRKKLERKKLGRQQNLVREDAMSGHV